MAHQVWWAVVGVDGWGGWVGRAKKVSDCTHGIGRCCWALVLAGSWGNGGTQDTHRNTHRRTSVDVRVGGVGDVGQQHQRLATSTVGPTTECNTHLEPRLWFTATTTTPSLSTTPCTCIPMRHTTNVAVQRHTPLPIVYDATVRTASTHHTQLVHILHLGCT